LFSQMRTHALVFLLLMTSLNTWGTEDASFNHSPQYRETARLSWKAGLSRNKNLQMEKPISFQVPVIMLELQLPVSDPYFKWLFHLGGGLLVEFKSICNPFFVPEPPEHPFDTPFFQRNYEKDYKKTTNPDTCSKKITSKSLPFFISQTGLKYGSGLYGILQGGIMLTTEGDVGWTGELLLGKKMGLDISGGVRMSFFNSSPSIGLVFYLGNTMKQWWTEQSFE